MIQSIDWLLKADEQKAIGHEEGVHVIPMPRDLGVGKIEAQTLPFGMNMYFLGYEFVPEVVDEWIETARMQVQLDEPTLTIQSILRGRGLMQDHLSNSVHHYGQGVALLSLCDQVDARYEAEAGPQLEGVVLEVTVSRLYRLLGEEAAVDLLSALRLEEGELIPVTNPLIQKHLHLCAAAHLTGPIRKLFLQSQVLNLLVDLAGLAQSPTPDQLSRSDLLRQIKAEVDQAVEKPPNLDELARRYGVSSRKINEDFKQAFGLSLIAYCAQQRLAAAHRALAETDIAMKVLAARLGYAHVNNFIAAFTRHFGYSPGSLRRAGPSDRGAN